ncbi:MAG: TRAP transporter small permease [Pseudomonadota bacterium]
MDFLEKTSRNVSLGLVVVGGIFLVGMIVLTCANILLRLVWLPVPGTFELMGFFGASATAFSLGYTQLKKGHIAVDILIDYFSPRTKRFLAVINSLLCSAFFVLVAWQLFLKGDTIRRTGEVTETLRIIYHPFIYGAALGCAGLALVLLTDFVKAIRPEQGGVK